MDKEPSLHNLQTNSHVKGLWNNYEVIRVKLKTAELLENIFMCMNKEKVREKSLMETTTFWMMSIMNVALPHERPVWEHQSKFFHRIKKPKEVPVLAQLVDAGCQELESDP